MVHVLSEGGWYVTDHNDLAYVFSSDETYDAESDTWTKRCETCGFEVSRLRSHAWLFSEV